MAKGFIKKDVNSVLLFLVMLTCAALLGLTIVFANSLDGASDAKVQLETRDQELAYKETQIKEIASLLDQHVKREKALEKLLEEGIRG